MRLSQLFTGLSGKAAEAKQWKFQNRYLKIRSIWNKCQNSIFLGKVIILHFHPDIWAWVPSQCLIPVERIPMSHDPNDNSNWVTTFLLFYYRRIAPFIVCLFPLRSLKQVHNIFIVFSQLRDLWATPSCHWSPILNYQTVKDLWFLMYA